MVNVEAVRRLLAIAEVNKDPYAVAVVAGSLLMVNRADGAALGPYARSLSALGLLSAAQRALGDSTSKVSTGLVPWKSRARRFAANLAALTSRDPAGAALVEAAARELEQYELHSATDGNFQVLDTTKEMPAAWLGGLAMHKAAEGLWKYDRVERPTVAPVALESLGFGWLFMKVVGTTERTYLNYSCAIYVLEGDPLGLAMLFHMHDLQEIIRQERVRWFVRATPAEAGAAFRSAIESNPAWSLPEQFIRCALRKQESTGAEAMLKDLVAARAQFREQRLAEGRAYYADKDADFWRKRFEEAASGTGERLRVLGITSRYTTVLRYSMAELCAAANDAGYDMRVAMEPDDSSVEHPYETMIAEFKPDLIVQISRLRYENPNLPANVPFLCWDQDNLTCMRTPAATASLNGLTFVAGHGAVFGFGHLNWPEQQLIFCHPAGATHRYPNRPVPAAVRERYACDFSYISNASGTPESLRDSLRSRWQAPVLKPLFDAGADHVIASVASGKVLDYLVLKSHVRQTDRQSVLSVALVNELAMDLKSISDRAFRHVTLQWVSNWCKANGKTLRIFGSGWEQHSTLAPHAAGRAEPGDEVRAIYQASRINLQIIENGFIHSRSLDGVAAGGFFLTRANPLDGVGSEVFRALRALALWAEQHGVTEEAEIENAASPQVRDWWVRTQRHFEEHEVRWALLRSLKVWAKVAPPCEAIPHLSEITFADEHEFAVLAARYLADDSARERIAADMREEVVRSFSYSARWGQFVSHVRDTLSADLPVLASR